MSRYFSILIFILCTFYSIAQEDHSKTYAVGDKVHISVDLYDEASVTHSVDIPNGEYTLMYKYDWDDDGDGKDRIEKIEKIIDKITKNFRIKDLKVICYSMNKGSDYEKWLKIVNDQKPFNEKPNFHVLYYNTNDYKLVAKNMKRLFEKLVFIGPDGKVLASSGSIGNFIVPDPPPRNIKTTQIRAKLLSESGGIKKPLKNTMVFVYSEVDADTISKTHTDMFGDFEIALPDDEKSTYQLKVDADQKSGKVLLVNVNGVEVAESEYKAGEFKFDLLKAEIIKLTDVEETEDVTMSYKLFLESGQNSLKIVRFISYGLAKFDLAKESEEVLDKIVAILKENPAVKLQVISHTDAQGEDKTNMNLSQKRSRAVADYLIAKGIDKKRLKGIGRGETEIRNRCKNGVECSDKEHEYNRRTEFHFIKDERKK